MEEVRSFLLDFDPASCLGHTLRNILGSSSHLDVKLQQASIESCGQELCDVDITRIISQYNPALTFVVLSPSMLKKASILFQSIRQRFPEMPIMVILEEGEPDGVFDFLKLKAVDFITPPLKAIDILPRVLRLLEQSSWRETQKQALKGKLGFKKLIGESHSFMAEVEKVPLVAKCDASVLISGETGTGKELFARAIHYLSSRASKPFIPVNCGAIPTELVENEVFGHERGAFTGAITSRYGIIHEADGGTLFLDEVDCLPLLAQVKLLRFLQEKEYRPLGSTKICKADVRVIAASNADFEESVNAGKLRQDLYYRLNVVPLKLPPLRDRQDDIPVLAHHFLHKYAFEFGRDKMDFSPGALQKLMLYNWPGNVRELEHVIERAVILCQHGTIQDNYIILSGKPENPKPKSFQEMKTEMITTFEKNYIQGLLLAHRGNITRAAHAANKNRRAFWQLIHKHRIDVQSYRPNSIPLA